MPDQGVRTLDPPLDPLTVPSSFPIPLVFFRWIKCSDPLILLYLGSE